MLVSIPVKHFDNDDNDSDFLVFQNTLKSDINIQIQQVNAGHYHASDLLDPLSCREIIQDFASRIEARNLTCAGSMFIKYWAVPLLYPYWYGALIYQVSLSWSLDQVVLDLPQDWLWDRTLLLDMHKKENHRLIQRHERFTSLFNQIVNDLTCIFKVISRVTKVTMSLIWENTALRILQFYDMLQRRGVAFAVEQNIQEQRHYLAHLHADVFGLKTNPFSNLIDHWSSDINTYAREKCCFYFQLPEAEHEYCKGCPLRKRDKTRDKYVCKNI